MKYAFQVKKSLDFTGFSFSIVRIDDTESQQLKSFRPRLLKTAPSIRYTNSLALL